MQQDGGNDTAAQNELTEAVSTSRLQTQPLSPEESCPHCAAAAARAAADAKRIEDLELQLQSLSLKASRAGESES